MSELDQNLYLTDFDRFLLAKGEWYRSFEKMGAHPAQREGVEGYHFAVWCPNVASVTVAGDFNCWNQQQNPLYPSDDGMWEGFVPGVNVGDCYKFIITTHDGRHLEKCDPYGHYAQVPPWTASRIFDPSVYEWHDREWITQRVMNPHMQRPLNIFEVHLGSWRRHNDGVAGNGDPNSDDKSGSYLTYDELSTELVDYVVGMGYTHLELMPVMEHPFDGSWGYQTTGYYAPTSRYGDPWHFKQFIDRCHQAGLGVILDWPGGGYCADEQGLANFNGGYLYENIVHPTWGTHKFNYASGHVRTFLASNLVWWVEEYHADGIRMDGVTSMLYLNFDISDPALKRFNHNGSEEDYAAIDFIRQANKMMGTQHPDVMMIAEESTAWPNVTRPPEMGGLGFHYKWAMGWMNDTLRYMQEEYMYRKYHHNLVTFSLDYVFDENFVLPLSHDEVVHGKHSLIGRMPGDYWRKFACLRALMLFQMTHPGGKLNFMGNEIGQFIEWRYYEGIEYYLADTFDYHRNQREFVRALNKFYQDNPALWEKAYVPEGFEWIDGSNADQCILSFVRHGANPEDDLVVIINWDVNTYFDYRIGVPTAGTWQEVFNSDDARCGGSGKGNPQPLVTQDVPAHGRAQSLTLTIPPLAGMIFKRIPEAVHKD
ncbi:MAG: 1,4-alpha-glucan branching protein GlgB [Coriobacteriia bacterium]|nr:1,4-alpha-glucan branching protein GlgB [Coriobacteriia bacterium]